MGGLGFAGREELKGRACHEWHYPRIVPLPWAAGGDPLPRYAVGLSWRDDWQFEYTPTTHAEARPRRTTGWPASRERLVSKRSIVFPSIAEARDFLHQFPDL
jgi:hypothetical protein